MCHAVFQPQQRSLKNTPAERERFQLWVFSFQPRHLSPSYWVETSPAGLICLPALPLWGRRGGEDSKFFNPPQGPQAAYPTLGLRGHPSGVEAGVDSYPLPTPIGAEVRVVLHLHRSRGGRQCRVHERHGEGSSPCSASTPFLSSAATTCAAASSAALFSAVVDGATTAAAGASGASGEAHRQNVADVPDGGGDVAALAAAAHTGADAPRRRLEEIEGAAAVAARTESAVAIEEEDITRKSWCNRKCIFYEPPRHTHDDTTYSLASACPQSLRGPAACSQESITVIRARFRAPFEGLEAGAKENSIPHKGPWGW